MKAAARSPPSKLPTWLLYSDVVSLLLIWHGRSGSSSDVQMRKDEMMNRTTIRPEEYSQQATTTRALTPTRLIYYFTEMAQR
ncbi:hypothetical protein OPV22_013568 [Ensete ventricosum]|uniref:Secreted protein n=1 Tax=Ensete ventricosum TaxID=4639 RepID=A0AAV8R9J8_ENSVE|nr:hypothetical protein OPV22_013568 [Ensete ventricosum]